MRAVILLDTKMTVNIIQEERDMITCSKGICTQVSIEDRSASRLTLSWDLSWYSVNTLTTSQSTAGWESTNYSTHHQVPTDTWVCPHLANYQPTVDQIDAERESIKCQSSVNQGSNKMSIKCQSNVHQRSNARMRICVPITHMIPKKNTKQERVIFFLMQMLHSQVPVASSNSELGKDYPSPGKTLSYLETHCPPTSHRSDPFAVFSSTLSSLPPTLPI